MWKKYPVYLSMSAWLISEKCLLIILGVLCMTTVFHVNIGAHV